MSEVTFTLKTEQVVKYTLYFSPVKTACLCSAPSSSSRESRARLISRSRRSPRQRLRALTSAGLRCRQAGTPHPGAVPSRKLEGGLPPSHVGTTTRRKGRGRITWPQQRVPWKPAPTCRGGSLWAMTRGAVMTRETKRSEPLRQEPQGQAGAQPAGNSARRLLSALQA